MINQRGEEETRPKKTAFDRVEWLLFALPTYSCSKSVSQANRARYVASSALLDSVYHTSTASDNNHLINMDGLLSFPTASDNNRRINVNGIAVLS